MGRPTEHVAAEEGAPTPAPTRSGAGAGPRGGAETGTDGDSRHASGEDATTDGAAADVAPAPLATSPARTAPPTNGTAPVGTVLEVGVRVTNGTGADVNTSIFVAMTSGGEDAEPVYDPDSGLTGPPGTMLPPGNDVGFTLAFAAQDSDDLVLDVQPAYHYDPVVFAGAR